MIWYSLGFEPKHDFEIRHKDGHTIFTASAPMGTGNKTGRIFVYGRELDKEMIDSDLKPVLSDFRDFKEVYFFFPIRAKDAVRLAIREALGGDLVENPDQPEELRAVQGRFADEYLTNLPEDAGLTADDFDLRPFSILTSGATIASEQRSKQGPDKTGMWYLPLEKVRTIEADKYAPDALFEFARPLPGQGRRGRRRINHLPVVTPGTTEIIGVLTSDFASMINPDTPKTLPIERFMVPLARIIKVRSDMELQEIKDIVYENWDDLWMLTRCVLIVDPDDEGRIVGFGPEKNLLMADLDLSSHKDE